MEWSGRVQIWANEQAEEARSEWTSLTGSATNDDLGEKIYSVTMTSEI